MRISHCESVCDPLETLDDWQVNCFSSTEEMAVVIEEMVAALADLGYSPKDVFRARLVLEEAICNAIKHGHRHDPSKVVEVRYRLDVDHFLVQVEDQGPGFTPSHVPDATDPANLERPTGRGLLLIRHYAAWVPNRIGNCVTFCIQKAEANTHQAHG